jgi:pilus assembly protein CpaB
VGLVTLAPIKKDEQILASKVIKPGPLTGLALQVSPTRRALALPISEVNGVSKLLRPGDRIDIVAAVDVGKGLTQHREVKTLMQDVPILATGLHVVNDLPILYEKQGLVETARNINGDTNFNTITVEATPEESQDLIYLLSTSPGALFVTLRHPSDHSKRRFPESTIDTLLGKVSQDMLNLQQRAPAAVTPPPVPMPEKKKKKGPFIDL